MGLKFHSKQRTAWEILRSDSKTRILFDGGSRSGKTALLCEFLIRRALQYPGSRQLAARRARVHAKSSLWNDTLKTYLRRYIPYSLYRFSETELTIHFFNASEIIVGGLDDADRTEKILGNEYITVYLNEATQLRYETVQMAMTRLAQRIYDANGHLAVPKLLLDCNPRGPRHWLHYVGVRQIDPDTEEPLPDAARWARVSWSAYDNLANLPKEYLHTLESLPAVMRDRMLHGIWRDNSGAVYEEFEESIHVVEPFEIPEAWTRVRGIDFGFTNPFVCLWGAVDPDGRLFLYREWYRANVRTIEHAETIRRMSGEERYAVTVADHDASERAELEHCGIRTVAARKDVRIGIQAVKTRLVCAGDGKPRLFFFKDLKQILSEIYEYRWSTASGTSNLKEEPLKLNDHAMDALRYLVMELDQGSKRTFHSASAKRQSDGRWQH